MTRKDYEVLADAFKRAFATNTDNNTVYSAGVEQALFEVSRKLQADNPRFNYDRFVQAARPELFNI